MREADYPSPPCSPCCQSCVTCLPSWSISSWIITLAGLHISTYLLPTERTTSSALMPSNQYCSSWRTCPTCQRPSSSAQRKRVRRPGSSRHALQDGTTSHMVSWGVCPCMHVFMLYLHVFACIVYVCVCMFIFSAKLICGCLSLGLRITSSSSCLPTQAITGHLQHSVLPRWCWYWRVYLIFNRCW